MAEDSPIKFPCQYVVKVMGSAGEVFENKVRIIVQRHFSDFDPTTMTKRYSKDHHYLSLSITLDVEYKGQLDALYEELSAAPEVLMAL